MKERIRYEKAEAKAIFFDEYNIFMNSSMQIGQCDRYSEFTSTPDGTVYLCLDVGEGFYVIGARGYQPDCRKVTPTPYIQSNVLCLGFGVGVCLSVVF